MAALGNEMRYLAMVRFLELARTKVLLTPNVRAELPATASEGSGPTALRCQKCGAKHQFDTRAEQR